MSFVLIIFIQIRLTAVNEKFVNFEQISEWQHDIGRKINFIMSYTFRTWDNIRNEDKEDQSNPRNGA